ncbi:MAG: YMGG-like glycine zipper-containing protein [bacterium]
MPAVVVAVALALPPMACTPTQKGAGIGAATGAAAGAMIDDHKRARGALIGAAAGGLVGGVIGRRYEITKYCPSCGRRHHRSKHFCPHCGVELRQRR